MNVEYINPFIRAVLDVFQTMLGCSLSRGEPYAKSSNDLLHEISGIIGLSGAAKGATVISLSRATALEATAALLGEHPGEVNADVIDAVGELANMVAGSAKAQLEHLALNVSLPTVVQGSSHRVDYPSGATPICVPFECSWGQVIVEFGLVEQPAPVS
ncbi:MAG: chemotaxis protein CheX [Pirellulales bacterium]|nr:chemotaxis protein CheX [Pirellulales bacterium]